MAHERINDRRDDQGVHDIRDELHALGDAASDNGRCRSNEYGLKKPECMHRYAIDRRLGIDQKPAAGAEQRPLSPIHQRVTEHEESKRREAEVDQILHQDVACVLCPNHAGLDHTESGLHEEHKERG